MFLLQRPKVTMYRLVYVDDISPISSSQTPTSLLIASLSSDFAVKDLGQLHFLLGIKVTHSSDGLALSQQNTYKNCYVVPVCLNASLLLHPCVSLIDCQLLMVLCFRLMMLPPILVLLVAFSILTLLDKIFPSRLTTSVSSFSEGYPLVCC
jgi:hypothetical protein